jgi:hypothetical protein
VRDAAGELALRARLRLSNQSPLRWLTWTTRMYPDHNVNFEVAAVRYMVELLECCAGGVVANNPSMLGLNFAAGEYGRLYICIAVFAQQR